MSKTGTREILSHFSPAWYASVMGTGGLANVLYLLGGGNPWLQGVATILWWLNILLFILLIGPWVARWLFHFDRVRGDLRHPLMSNFFITMPAGCVILGTNFFLMGKLFFSPAFILDLGLVLWLVGVIMAFAFGVFGTYNLMTIESIGPEPINFAWLMTPVVSIVVPLLGNALVKGLAGSNHSLALLINVTDIVFYGIGFLLFIIMAPIVTNRFIAHKLPPAMVTPTFWVLLGPVGVGTVALMGLADASRLLGLLTAVDAVKFFATVLWGFGLWAFALVVAITLRYLKSGGVPFTLSWWAFIFPLAAYTLSGIEVYAYTKVPLVYWYAVLLAILLTVLWTLTFSKTLAGTLSGRLLLPPAGQPGQGQAPQK